uniref:Putative stromal cell-derived factor 2 n=1 Tax=Xenopsylla cheopis TaxID=163159 RepID=A0A6M2DX55_XENCH
MWNLLNIIVILYICGLINIISASKSTYVTCGSVLKLLNEDGDVRLHSHDVKYGTGSGQQSVTGTKLQEDSNSHWLIKAATGKTCSRGEPIECGSIIRLQHMATKKNLHSHFFQSPLSGNQEISCYGDSEGIGDTGDHWMVVCSGDKWKRTGSVKLRHVDTQSYLATSGRTFGQPISGQAEIVGVSNPHGGYVDWKAAEGIFIHPTDFDSGYRSADAAMHTEL